MSNFKLESNITGADPEFASYNVDNTLKCPINWTLTEESEVSNRYSQDSTENDEWNISIDYSESVTIPIKTQNVYKGTNKPIFKCKVKLIGVDGYITINDEHIELVGNETTWISYELETGTDGIKIVPSFPNNVQIYEGSSITFSTNKINFVNEFANYGIKTNLTNGVTIGNTSYQIKTGKTVNTFSNDSIITPAENYEMLDVLNFTRLNKCLTLIYIQDKETAGNTLANMPQDSTQQYYFISYTTTEKSGLYEYITINYQQDTTTGVY